MTGSGAQSTSRSSSRTVRLGSIRPQAPSYRSICCNDREANALVKFKTSGKFILSYNLHFIIYAYEVKQDGFFPADILFLASTNVDGTSNLDGETNLKIRKALEKTWDYLTPEKAWQFKGEIQCEQPNNSLYTFTGNLVIDKQTLPLSPNQLLLRGCSLRNTEYIVGVVIYTGHETKVVILTMFTLITLFSTVIPISLYVSIEGIKFIQSIKFINNDLNMYHAETNTPALARTSNLNEELGQVEYIFTDKTGTLTRNLMEFFKCSIGGQVYGTGTTEIERGVAERTGVKVREEFFRCLAICHTVLPEGEESPEKIVYQAASPDEAALGADTVIYERLGEGNDDLKKVTREHLEQFGSSGLRTLCLAYRDLSQDMYETWNEKFIQAKSSLRDRERKLDEVAELIEKDLILIGSTAIEDKLQEGVPACIETLQSAGIKIWVLTGDKIETAINIAYACNLINNDMKQFIISSETDDIREVEDRGDPVEIARFIKEAVKTQLMKCIEEAEQILCTVTGPSLALVIDGKCLMYALDLSLRDMLLNLSLNCRSVVCCRVSPLQKAQVTTLVKKGAKKITLSIGDGANDVSMIQAAHVGVGISGLEGMQAVMASDFAIAQFRFLTDLLLVHGRWSYIRICKDVNASLSKKYPQLYMEGLRNENIFYVIFILMSTPYFYLALVLVPSSRHTGFAFDSPGYESFFAAQAGVFAPQKAWDVARRASTRRSKRQTSGN
ncbi:hypothetical protein Cgig2_031217 [Carnegiea gigantea]|uniref:Phospholipid-transporting ATPase n=1 Tax=Carnegiea gigantea TaxID=171969 RepID=A0A9Q1KM95_9CARY|nr:hypothetical protein Cgig2_031217 [Carnegiea gigantea]